MLLCITKNVNIKIILFLFHKFWKGKCTMIFAFSKLYLNFLLQSEKLESGKTNIKKWCKFWIVIITLCWPAWRCRGFWGINVPVITKLVKTCMFLRVLVLFLLTSTKDAQKFILEYELIPTSLFNRDRLRNNIYKLVNVLIVSKALLVDCSKQIICKTHTFNSLW